MMKLITHSRYEKCRIPVITTPLTHRTLQDWDCAGALDLGLLGASLGFIAAHGRLPPGLQSKEDRNAVGESDVSDRAVEAYRRDLVAGIIRPSLLSAFATPPSPSPSPAPGGAGAASAVDVRICVLDGFLLYPDPDLKPDPSIPAAITDRLDLKLFLRSTHARTKARREARQGYVTLEGFWRDPDGYVDEVVWPNYVREHAWMFEAGDVDAGGVRREVQERWRIEVAPGFGESGVGDLLAWAVGLLGARVGREVRDGMEEGGGMEVDQG